VKKLTQDQKDKIRKQQIQDRAIKKLTLPKGVASLLNKIAEEQIKKEKKDANN
jgi:hypothetical protein